MSDGQRLPGPLGLLHPLRAGDELLPGRVVQRAAFWHERMVFVIDERRIVVERPKDDGSYNARTATYGIYTEAPFDRPAEAIVRRMAVLIRANEDRHDPMGTPIEATSPNGPAVYLVPGHLGDPLDLTLRALHTLAGAELILVEPNKTDATRALLAQHGIDAARIAELDDEAAARMRACLAAGTNVAVFGVNEGIPGFCDPGKDVLAEAEAPIRTVGGASVLGMALMRVPAPIRRFTFLGTVHSEGEAGRAVERWAGDDLPALLFSWGQSLPDLLDRLDRCRRRPIRLHLLIALTQHDERVITGSVPSLRREAIDAREPVVVILERASISRPESLWDEARRIARRVLRR